VEKDNSFRARVSREELFKVLNNAYLDYRRSNQVTRDEELEENELSAEEKEQSNDDMLLIEF
jgi:hypothetical protein